MRHQDLVNSVAFDFQEQELLLMASEDPTIKAWHLRYTTTRPHAHTHAPFLDLPAKDAEGTGQQEGPGWPLAARIY